MRRHGFPRYLVVVSTCIMHVTARKVHTHMAKRSLFKNGPSSNGPAISSSWRTVHKGPNIHFAKKHATDGFNQPWCQCLVHLTNNQPHQKVNPKYPLVVRHGHGTSTINGGLIRTNHHLSMGFCVAMVDYRRVMFGVSVLDPCWA